MAANRCAEMVRSGRQCSKQALEGQPYCAKHVPLPKTTDPKVILERLLESNDKRIQLRAVVAYTRMIKTLKCKRCEAELQRGRERDDLFARLTDEQRQEISSLGLRFREIKAQARKQPIRTVDDHPDAPAAIWPRPKGSNDV